MIFLNSLNISLYLINCTSGCSMRLMHDVSEFSKLTLNLVHGPDLWLLKTIWRKGTFFSLFRGAPWGPKVVAKFKITLKELLLFSFSTLQHIFGLFAQPPVHSTWILTVVYGLNSSLSMTTALVSLFDFRTPLGDASMYDIRTIPHLAYFIHKIHTIY